MDRFIFTDTNDNHDSFFRDLTIQSTKDIIEFFPSHKVYKNRIMNTIEKVCLSYRLNSKFRVPGQHFFYNLDSYSFNDYDTYHILMPTLCVGKLSIEYLKDLCEKHHNVKLYALVIDSMHASSLHMQFVRDKLLSDVWETVLTFDKNDAQEFGFKWIGYSYYSAFNHIEPNDIQSDIYYVGVNKGGKEQLVSNIYEFLLDNSIKARFDVVANILASDHVAGKGRLHYLDKVISYPEVVSRVRSANCILEILQDGQKSQSVRYFEAIVYNKKLLTMNELVKELPYYNPDYIKVFKDISDIDLDWVREKVSINYGYCGDFSPIHIIDLIKSK